MRRILDIVWAKIMVNCYCLWRNIRYFDFLCEINMYNYDKKLIFIAASKGSLLKKNIEIVKIFYNPKGICYG